MFNGGQIFGPGNGAGAGRGLFNTGAGALGGAPSGALFGGGALAGAPKGNGLFAPPAQAAPFPGQAQAQAQAQGNLQFGGNPVVFGAGAAPANNATGVFGSPAPVFGGAAPNVFGAAPAGGQQPAQQAFGFGQQPAQQGGNGIAGLSFGNLTAGTGGGGFQFAGGVNTGFQIKANANAGQQSSTLSLFNPQHAPQDDFPNKKKFSDIESMYAPVSQRADGKYTDIPLGDKGKPKSKKEIGQSHRWNDNCAFEFAYFQTPSKFSDLERGEEVDSNTQDLVDRDNPDREKYLSVFENGITYMKMRFEILKKKEDEMLGTVQDVEELYRTADKRAKKTALKYAELQHKQKQLYHRLLLVMSKIEVMRNKNQPISQGETRLKACFDRIIAQMTDPERELQKVKIKLAQLERRSVADKANPVPVIASEDIKGFKEILSEQNKGLNYLSKVLVKDRRDISIVEKKLAQQRERRNGW